VSAGAPAKNAQDASQQWRRIAVKRARKPIYADRSQNGKENLVRKLSLITVSRVQ
jgi:hypothetical protein